jgi:glycosyl transferase family 25
MTPKKPALNIHLVNLDRSTDRLATFEAVNSHIMPHVTRFPAIDGKSVTRATFVEQGIIAPDLGYKDGALGDALSQITLWDMAIRENRSLTICEDDAIFNARWLELSFNWTPQPAPPPVVTKARPISK